MKFSFLLKISLYEKIYSVLTLVLVSNNKDLNCLRFNVDLLTAKK